MGIVMATSNLYGEDGKNSLALINEVSRATEIDKETAILLEAQAIFAPEELP